MHYVSWDRTDRDAPKLLAEAGPETLAEFRHDSATLSDGSTWTLISTPEAGAKATVAETGQELVSAPASLKRDKQIPVMIGGEPYTLIAESSKNWIIDDANGNKVAQFTSDHNGVRRSVLESTPRANLPTHRAQLTRTAKRLCHWSTSSGWHGCRAWCLSLGRWSTRRR